MKATPTELPEVLLIEPDALHDDRGFFLETFQAEKYRALGVTGPFLQDNWSRSHRGTLRGLHFQEPRAQGKLVFVVHGSVFDVAVDIRRGSPRFGKWIGTELSESNHRQLWIPPGFAHGFCVTGDEADFVYKCTEVYDRGADRVALWNDPDIGIRWPVSAPRLSQKDATAPRLADCPVLPSFPGT